MQIYQVETQADYDALMVELEGRGVVWGVGVGKPTRLDIWKVNKQDTCIFVKDSKISYCGKAHYLKKYPNIPIQKYKANDIQLYHVETQEDYDALMVELEDKGVDWGAGGDKPTRLDLWKSYKQDTCISVEDSEILYSDKAYYLKNFPDIPIQKYKASDTVNSPSHYTQGELEVIDILEDKLTPQEFEGFLKGNILKYTFREGIKNGTEDMKKGAWYMARLIEFRKGKD